MHGRATVAVTALVGAACAVVGGIAIGARGVVSALVAVGVVVLFFWSGLVPLVFARVSGNAGLSFIVLMTNYALRLVLALVALAAATRAGLVDGAAVGLTLIACTLTWTGAQVALLSRSGGTG